MKQYVVDQLRPADFIRLKGYLDENFLVSGVTGVYWLPVDHDYLTDIQLAHTDCQPYHFAVVLEPDLVSCELLVRSKTKIKCDCIGYATKKQRNWLIDVIDAMLDMLEIKI